MRLCVHPCLVAANPASGELRFAVTELAKKDRVRYAQLVDHIVVSSRLCVGRARIDLGYGRSILGDIDDATGAYASLGSYPSIVNYMYFWKYLFGSGLRYECSKFVTRWQIVRAYCPFGSGSGRWFVEYI